jgi:NADH-quinone oxidoreductase subunit L
MTGPLVVLATMSVVAGFLYAEPIHVAPLGHLLDPLFEKPAHMLGHRHEAEGLMWAMMAPGVLAFVVGSALAYYIYMVKGGQPERDFARSSPGLYKLIYDKWRIDELYDATVVGMVDALADIFTMADKWIIDGIIAKLSAALVGALGTVLRAFQTGRVHAYGAAMMIGLAGLGWFVMQPHTAATVDTRELRQSGAVKISAAPGLGYRYRWEIPGQKAPEGFGETRDVTVTVAPGEKKEVVLQVQNAFKSVATERFSISNPQGKRAPEPSAANGSAPSGGAR